MVLLAGLIVQEELMDALAKRRAELPEFPAIGASSALRRVPCAERQACVRFRSPAVLPPLLRLACSLHADAHPAAIHAPAIPQRQRA